MPRATQAVPLVVGLALLAPAFAAAQTAPRGGPPRAAAPARSAATIDTTFVLPEAATRAPDTALTLAAALARAFVASPLAAQGAADQRNARSAERVARGAYLPTLSISPTLVQTGASTPRGSVVGVPSGTAVSGFAYGASANLAVDVFTAGRRGDNVRSARAQIASTNARALADRYTVVDSVTSAFYAVERAEDLVTVARAQLAAANQDVAVVAHRVQVGTAMLADLLTARLAVATARRAILQDATDRRTAVYALGRLTGLPGTAGAVRGDSIVVRPLALSDSAITRLAATTSPSVRAAGAAVAAADALHASARSEYAPTITVGYSYGYVSRGASVGPNRPGGIFQVGASYSIFDAFIREDAVERATSAVDVARSTSSDAVRQGRATAERLLGTIELAANEIALDTASVTEAAEAYRVARARYGAGAATLLELTTAATTLATTQQALVGARYSYQLARASLAALLGLDL